jgi:hypothetical protein
MFTHLIQYINPLFKRNQVYKSTTFLELAMLKVSGDCHYTERFFTFFYISGAKVLVDTFVQFLKFLMRLYAYYKIYAGWGGMMKLQVP